jgi:hypothetical protein
MINVNTVGIIQMYSEKYIENIHEHVCKVEHNLLFEEKKPRI